MSTCEQERLLDQLKSADANARGEAAERVRKDLPPPSRRAVIDQLVDHLGGKYYDVRWQAARALGLIGTARGDVLDALARRLTDKHEYVRRCAAEALARIGSAHTDLPEGDSPECNSPKCDRVTDALNGCLDDECEEVRRAATRALQAIAGQSATGSPNSAASTKEALGEALGMAPGEEIREGKVYEGEVKALKDYGAFVEILPERVGLLHVSEMGHGYIEDVADYCQPGDCIRVELLEVTSDGDLSLTRKPFVGPGPWADVEDKCSVGDTISGEVASTEEFGAFVNLEPGVTGLIHVSEMAEDQADHAGEVVSEGQQVTAEILEINAEDEQMSLRLKQTGSTSRAVQKCIAQDAQRSNGRASENGRSDREVLLVDGSNVCRNWAAPEGTPTASLNALLTLLVELVAQGFDFECIFDANIPHVLRRRGESGAEDACNRLAKELPSRVSKVPGGTDADDPILQKADQRDLRIVTNDRFREKRETYPWIDERESERLIKGSVHGADLQVVSLGLFTEVRTDTRRMVDRLAEAAGQNGGHVFQDSFQDADSRAQGSLKWFDPERGFGFIEPEGQGEDVFLHGSKIPSSAAESNLREGQKITFEVKHTPKGPQAVNASPIT